MVEVGLIGRDERFELIGGEIVPMSPKGIRHERLKQWLATLLYTGLTPDYQVIPETTLRLSDDSFMEPDFIVYGKDTDLKDLSGDTCLLVIEIADSSRSYDLGRKPEVYAAFGIAETWVIDVRNLNSHVHRDPTPTGYRTIVQREPEFDLGAQGVPELRLRLADYGRP